MGRREQDQYRAQLTEFADKVFHGEVEGLKLVPSKMPADKYYALMDFMEKDFYDLIAPAPFDPAMVDVAGLEPDAAATKIGQARIETEKMRTYLFSLFEGFSRAKTAGLTERIDWQQNLFAYLRILGHIGSAIERWAELQPLTEAELIVMRNEILVQGQRPIPLLTGSHQLIPEA
jgi:hypothetical protein